jgi:hypothetical protein
MKAMKIKTAARPLIYDKLNVAMDEIEAQEERDYQRKFAESQAKDAESKAKSKAAEDERKAEITAEQAEIARLNAIYMAETQAAEIRDKERIAQLNEQEREKMIEAMKKAGELVASFKSPTAMIGKPASRA